MARKTVEKNIAYDDKKKLYYVTLNYGMNENNKRIKETKTFKQLVDARKCLKLFEAEKIKGTVVMRRRDSLEEYIKYWIKRGSINWKKTTLYGYKNILFNHMIPYLGQIELQKLNARNVNDYVMYLKEEKHLSNNTIRKHQDLLKDILGDALKEEKVFKNIMLQVELVKVEKVKRSVYNIEKVVELLEKVEGHPLEVPVKLAIYLGLRREEINGLKWENVDFKKKIIYITSVRTQAGKEEYESTTKTETSDRRLSMTKSVFNLLNNVKEKQELNKQLLGKEYKDGDYVFCKEDGSLYRANYCSNEFKRFLEKNDLPHIRFHDLRHSFASLANEANVTLYNASKLLGHSSPQTTSDIYMHLFDDTNKGDLEAIEDLISRSKGV